MLFSLNINASIAQNTFKTSCKDYIVLNDSTKQIKIQKHNFFAFINFTNHKTIKTLSIPCESWTIYTGQNSCDTTKKINTFSTEGQLTLNNTQIESGLCFCTSCSWKQRTFDSVPKPLFIYGQNCNGKISIIKKNKLNPNLPLWIQKEYKSGEEFNLNNILFSPNKSLFLKTSYEELDFLFLLLKEQKHLRIKITGHVNAPDQKNTIEFQELSENRAKAVVDYLIEKGISKDRLEYKGFGNTKMLYFNPKTDLEMTENRRVEITVL